MSAVAGPYIPAALAPLNASDAAAAAAAAGVSPAVLLPVGQRATNTAVIVWIVILTLLALILVGYFGRKNMNAYQDKALSWWNQIGAGDAAVHAQRVTGSTVGALGAAAAVTNVQQMRGRSIFVAVVFLLIILAVAISAYLATTRAATAHDAKMSFWSYVTFLFVSVLVAALAVETIWIFLLELLVLIWMLFSFYKAYTLAGNISLIAFIVGFLVALVAAAV